MGDGIRNIDKGNTEIMAKSIRDLTGADLWKVESIEEYQYHYQECCNVVKEEIHNQVRPKVKNELKDIKDYDVIYIGGPVWWYKPVPAIRTFLSQYDLSNKTIIPFACNCGWLGKTFEEIKKMCPNSKIEKEMNIEFESYSDRLKTSQEKVETWISNKKESDNI